MMPVGEVTVLHHSAGLQGEQQWPALAAMKQEVALQQPEGPAVAYIPAVVAVQNTHRRVALRRPWAEAVARSCSQLSSLLQPQYAEGRQEMPWEFEQRPVLPTEQRRLHETHCIVEDPTEIL